jgi:8-oxo-dGTP diphosphatase
MTPPALVVAAAIVDDLMVPRRLLAARRSAPKSLAGRWEFPGGKVEPGETHHEALRRELAEELGIAITIGRAVLGPVEGAWEVTRGHLMRVWLVRIDVGEPEPLLDHDEIRWLEPDRWHDVPWLDADVPIVRALQALA